jgi:hypothetical protein
MHEMICSSFQAGALYPATDVLRLGTSVPGYVKSRIVTKKKKSILFNKSIFNESKKPLMTVSPGHAQENEHVPSGDLALCQASGCWV